MSHDWRAERAAWIAAAQAGFHAALTAVALDLDDVETEVVLRGAQPVEPADTWPSRGRPPRGRRHLRLVK